MYDTGWWLTYPSEKYESQLVLWFPNIMENKKCSKPPTRYGHMVWYLVWYMVYVWYVIYMYMYIYMYDIWYMLWYKICMISWGRDEIYPGYHGQSIYLVVDLPLWKIWKSVGIIIPINYGKIKNVPNHQTVVIKYHMVIKYDIWYMYDIKWYQMV